MATTKQDIRDWFERGVACGAAYMLVMCDTFDWDDYPVFVNNEMDCLFAVRNPSTMQKVMEVYNLQEDMVPQLNMIRAWRLPQESSNTH